MAVRVERIAGYSVRVQRRRDSRKIRLRVRDDGVVSVTAPYSASNASIRQLVESQRDWIEQQLATIADRPSARFEQASPQEQAKWRFVVEAFVPPLLEKWEPVIGVRHKKLAYRNMKSRWGSCQPQTGRICINTRLALFPPQCLEYVIVHELCHLRVPNHGPEFEALLDQYLPPWRAAERLLNPR